jgi:cell fate regulator YaaT (PSP1 superfamily)
MKSCFVRFDRLTGVLEMEAPDEISMGDQIVCELDKGEALGIVATEPVDTTKEGLKKILRKATPEELSAYAAMREKEAQAFSVCRKKIEEMSLPMKLLRAEYNFGASKLLFYFFSENRVDFRDLVKELAKEFKVRIEIAGVPMGEGAGSNKKIAQQNAAQNATINYNKELILSRIKGEMKNELLSH